MPPVPSGTFVRIEESGQVWPTFFALTDEQLRLCAGGEKP
jgi:hypothetical protein